MSAEALHRVEVDIVTPVLVQLAAMKADGYPIHPDYFAPTTRYLGEEPSYVPTATVEMLTRYLCPERGEPFRYAGLREALAFWRTHPERIFHRMLIVRRDGFLVPGGGRFGDRVQPAFESIGNRIELNLSDAQGWWDDPHELLVKL